MKHFHLVFSTIIALVLISSACAPAPTLTPTLIPSLIPTVIPKATATAIPTLTPIPTDAPTITPTPGPLVIKDDFSTKSNIWGACDQCQWINGKLLLGPYAPRGSGLNQVFTLICEACGEHPYFRVAADVTFASGYGGDREYGVGGVVPDKYFAGAGISTTSHGILDAFDFATNTWSGSGWKIYNAIKAGAVTNHVEFIVKPDASGSLAYYSIVNGTTIVTLSGQHERPLKPDLYLAWHSVGVIFDNFEFEEIIP
jgi:hypothetical protein